MILNFNFIALFDINSDPSNLFEILLVRNIDFRCLICLNFNIDSFMNINVFLVRVASDKLATFLLEIFVFLFLSQYIYHPSHLHESLLHFIVMNQ